MVVGNKSDLSTKRQVPYEEGLSLCKELRVAFCETSSVSGQNVRRLFFESSKMVLHKIETGALHEQDFKPKFVDFSLNGPRGDRDGVGANKKAGTSLNLPQN